MAAIVPGCGNMETRSRAPDEDVAQGGETVNAQTDIDIISESGDDMQEEEKAHMHEGTINFYLYNSYTVDTRGVAKSYSVAEGTPFTYFAQVYDLETWRELTDFEESGFEYPDFDFTSDDFRDKYLAVTFGRELLEMQYEYCGEPWPSNYIAKADITFAEEYHDQTMFLYVMDKIPLLDNILGNYGNAFYIMDGKEKVYMGCDTVALNEIDDSWLLENPTFFYSKDDLAQAFHVDFAGMEITDIRYENAGGAAGINIFCKGPDDALESSDFEQLSPENIPDNGYLSSVGINRENIGKYGICSVENEDGATRLVEWYQWDKSSDDENNILLHTIYPGEVVIKVKDIIGE